MKYIKIFEGSGLISCAKHFPGHGDTAIDSHISLPVITNSLAELRATDLVPFINAVRAGVSSVMMGHLTIPAVDSKPASLSKMMISGLVRKEMGFDGLILTDALNMKALKDFENVPVQCIKAGADILLHPLDADLTVKELKKAITDKMISEEDIDCAINRILKTKAKIQNKTTPQYPPLVKGELKGGEVDYQSHTILSSQITDMSITLLKNTKGLPMLDPMRTQVVLAGEQKFFESTPFKNYFMNISTVPYLQVERVSLENVFSERIVIFAICTTGARSASH